jgi:RNA polymerase sigma factor (sigma-70 family)
VIDDRTLLRRYSANGDPEAFSELVRRYIALVYRAALRQVDDAGLAEEVVQITFTRLAQRADRIPEGTVLAGWLHCDTRFTALQLLRSDQRRRGREAQATHMQQINGDPEVDWTKVRPVLDEVLEKLGGTDRDILLLRFFQERSLRDVGNTLAVSEDAARMRVARALAKLRDILLARGISTPGEALGLTLSTYGIQAAPPWLAAIVSTSALAANAPSGAAAIGLLTTMKTKLTIFGILVTTAIVTPVLWHQHQLNSNLRAELQSLQAEVQTLRSAREEAERKFQGVASDFTLLKQREAELIRLRGELTRARKQLAMWSSRDRAAEQQNQVDQAAVPQAGVNEAEIALFLQKPQNEQGELLGELRRQILSPEKARDNEFVHNHALAEAIRPKLEELESQPDKFAQFQSAFLKAAIGIDDESKLTRIRKIMEETYEKAVAEQLDSKSRPVQAEQVQAWALRRDALDRTATHAVQELLSADERSRFDRAFLGVMGIDLGLNDGAWHRFVQSDGSIVFPSESQEPKP